VPNYEIYSDFDTAKRAGGGTVGLFPFPRVGRSDPDLLPEWDSSPNYNSFENYDGKFPYHKQIK
jgi:hypothetical protein